MFNIGLVCCVLLSGILNSPSLLVVMGFLFIGMLCSPIHFMAMGPWFCQDQVAVVMSVLVLMVSFMSLTCSISASPLSWGFIFSLMMSAGISLLFFMSVGLIPFFVFFEAGLLPLMALILGWGYQPERLQACLYLILYTVAGSVPMFGMICWSYLSLGSDNMILLFVNGFTMSPTMWIMLLTGFFVKMPVFGVHGWLPKAHVEAPLAGSMILAGVLLKFGCYGLMRVLWCFNWNSCFMGELIISVSIWGGLVSGLLCLVQSDIKGLIAYSSISHMSLVMVGLFSCSGVGWSSSLLMMFSHGLSSPILFGLAGYTYSIYQTRSMMVCKGLLALSPMLSTLLFVGSVLGMGCPPGVNFMSEVLLMASGSMFSWVIAMVMGIISFLSAAYSIYLYSSVTHGGASIMGKSWVKEYPGLTYMFMTCYSLFILCFCLDVFFMC